MSQLTGDYAIIGVLNFIDAGITKDLVLINAMVLYQNRPRGQTVPTDIPQEILHPWVHGNFLNPAVAMRRTGRWALRKNVVNFFEINFWISGFCNKKAV